jgi:hypothetical protein
MEQFKHFLADHQPEFVATEASVYSRTQRYAGTLDAIVRLNGQLIIVDYKTRGGTNYPLSGQTKGAIYPDDALQLAAYRHADFIGLPDGSEQAMYETDGAAILLLTDTGYQFMEVDAGDETFQFFLYVREVFRWQQEKSKKVLLGDFPATLETAGMAWQPTDSAQGNPSDAQVDALLGEMPQ